MLYTICLVIRNYCAETSSLIPVTFKDLFGILKFCVANGLLKLRPYEGGESGFVAYDETSSRRVPPGNYLCQFASITQYLISHAYQGSSDHGTARPLALPFLPEQERILGSDSEISVCRIFFEPDIILNSQCWIG